MRAKSYEEWTHLWANNPVYQEFPDWPIGWVFENDDNEIVGHIANVPLSYEFNGRRIIAAASGALVADSRYRTYAFRLLSHCLSQRNVDLLVDTTANATAAKAHEVFRSIRVPAGTWDRSVFWITNNRGFTASLLARKNVPFAKPLSVPLSLGLCLKKGTTKIRLQAQKNSCEVSDCTHFDQRFDDFWRALTKRYPSLLLATRSQQVLRWHFKYALAQQRVWIVTATHGSRLVAYSLFMRCDIPEFGLKRVRLVDFQTLEGKNELLLPMLDWALERCRAEGVCMMEALGFASDKQTIIDRVAPYKRKLSSWLYFYKVNDQKLAQDLKHPKVWDPSCFDGDASL